ncbi:putative response regulator [Methanocella paludicola SANAE]|uniref:Response regulator n=1 Tax=Methanocella paludicola (strain DSM 17711 / JCM 13418 / NBRC 101707 / SANAE) TaxID=304371 RepID=D1YZ50_METPS|nr:response regulator [Methanocella paludicola]BAI61722.1 putative response regulator [Methanocella paludicola SANAE]
MTNRVLVVDDNPDICDIVSIALKGKGIEVRTAETGNDGISIFLQFMPDIVLLDYKLPDMDGNDVAKKIKATGKATGIIRMTGENVIGNDVDMSLYVGKLQKPFKLAEMVQYVEDHIKK